MASSSIEWTERTWNPTTGCHKVSQGCKFCYALKMTRRLQGMGSAKYAAGFDVVVEHESALDYPATIKKPSTFFVNSMSDLFHKAVSRHFRSRVFQVMRICSWHTFQVLTKRSQILVEENEFISWPPNVWMGVSVEDTSTMYRIDHLRQTGARIKFLSLEPLLGPLPGLDLTGIDWVIVGGESGSTPRAMQPEWVEAIRISCEAAGVAFFFKQWGGTNKKAAGRMLNGRTYDEMPTLTKSQNL